MKRPRRWLTVAREALCMTIVCRLRGHRPRPVIPLRDDEPFIAECCCGRLSAIDPTNPVWRTSARPSTDRLR